MSTNIILSRCVSASVPLIARKMLLLASFLDIEDLCTPSYYHPAFSGYAYINGNRVLCDVELAG